MRGKEEVVVVAKDRENKVPKLIQKWLKRNIRILNSLYTKVLQSWIFHKKRVSKVSLASKTSRILTTCNDSNRGRTSTSKMHTTQQPQSQREGAPIPPNERTSTIRMLSQAIKSTLTVRRTHTHIASTNAFSLNCKEAMTLKRWRSYVVRHRDACLPNLVLPINAGNPEVEKNCKLDEKIWFAKQ